MKFFVSNYSCLQNPWLGGYQPQIPILSVLNWICWSPCHEENSWVRHWWRYSFSDMLQFQWHVTVSMTCYSFSDMLQFQWHVTVSVTCYSFSDMLQFHWHVTVSVTCYSFSDMLHPTAVSDKIGSCKFHCNVLLFHYPASFCRHFQMPPTLFFL